MFYILMRSCNERQVKRALAADGREARRKARDDGEGGFQVGTDIRHLDSL